MTLPKLPLIGTPVPQDQHAVSVHLPAWQDMVDLGSHHPRLGEIQQGGYPRSYIHSNIRELANRCHKKHGLPNYSYFFFPSKKYCDTIKSYVLAKIASERNYRISNIEMPTETFAFRDQVSRGNDSKEILIYSLQVPTYWEKHAMYFWRLTGFGISSRLAAKCLQSHPRLLPEETKLSTDRMISRYPNRKASVGSADMIIRQRLASLQNSGRIKPGNAEVTSDMVFLYPSGMAAIHDAHELLSRVRYGKTVVFGFLYELTPKLLGLSGPGLDFFGNGTTQELMEIERLCKAQRKGDAKTQIQAVWCECASNPLLRTVDLKALRKLADKYGFLIVVDDTIGSVANVDVLDVADVIVTSLTKSFSGYANVMAGSVTLSPSSKYYDILHQELSQMYENTLFREDAIQLELNSRNYLARTKTINKTSSHLVRYLQGFLNKTTPLTAVYYPETCPATRNYRQQMRVPDGDSNLIPGFGGLFTIEFADVQTAAAFFDALAVHKGPSLGAQFTLAQPYIQTVFQKEKAWAARYGLNESIVRISVGLEKRGELETAFEVAMEAAINVYRGNLKSI